MFNVPVKDAALYLIIRAMAQWLADEELTRHVFALASSLIVSVFI